MNFYACISMGLALTAAPAAVQMPTEPVDHTVQVAPGIYNVTWANDWGNMGLNVTAGSWSPCASASSG